MKINFTLILIMLISLLSFAQSNDKIIPYQSAGKDSASINSGGTFTDSVNISDMVLAQIQAAKKKQAEEKNQPALMQTAVVTKTHQNSSSNFLNDWEKSLSLSEDTMIKIIILASTSLFAIVFISFRRMRNGHKNSDVKSLKNGIKLMREEKVLWKNDKKLSGIRTKLSGSPSAYELTNESISRNAREMKIAKEEIYLAARIRSQELSKASGNSSVRKKMR